MNCKNVSMTGKEMIMTLVSILSMLCQITSANIFVSEQQWQKELLKKYGQSMFLLDATYKVTKYLLPLIFVCVKTNNYYIVIG